MEMVSCAFWFVLFIIVSSCILIERGIRLKVYKTLTFYILLNFKYCLYNNNNKKSLQSQIYLKKLFFNYWINYMCLYWPQEHQALVLFLLPSLVLSIGYIEYKIQQI